MMITANSHRVKNPIRLCPFLCPHKNKQSAYRLQHNPKRPCNIFIYNALININIRDHLMPDFKSAASTSSATPARVCFQYVTCVSVFVNSLLWPILCPPLDTSLPWVYLYCCGIGVCEIEWYTVNLEQLRWYAYTSPSPGSEGYPGTPLRFRFRESSPTRSGRSLSLPSSILSLLTAHRAVCTRYSPLKARAGRDR